MNCERLIFMRDNLDVSQRDMAKLLKVSKSTYGRWETGEKIIPLEHLIDFCNITKIDLDYAIGLSERKTKLTNEIIIDRIKIGNNLKKIRNLNNLTQKEFAESINTVQSVISSYEKAITLIQTSFLYDICYKYNISSKSIIN